jgi:hypothetical protein
MEETKNRLLDLQSRFNKIIESTDSKLIKQEIADLELKISAPGFQLQDSGMIKNQRHRSVKNLPKTKDSSPLSRNMVIELKTLLNLLTSPQ